MLFILNEVNLLPVHSFPNIMEKKKSVFDIFEAYKSASMFIFKP